MPSNHSIHGGQQEFSLTELKMQYADLLKPYLERFWAHKLTCTPCIAGDSYEDSPFRLMYVGRAVNGWESVWKKGTADELADQVFAHGFKLASITEEPIQNGYNFNRSPFWQLCKELMKLAGEEHHWSDRILWSNLYKLSPYKTGNPDNKLIADTIEDCVRILQYEINLYRPKHAVFVTDAWWFDPSDTVNTSFAQKLGILVKHNTKDVIVGKGIHHSDRADNVKIVVTKRPEGLNISREKHAEMIFNAFASLD